MATMVAIAKLTDKKAMYVKAAVAFPQELDAKDWSKFKAPSTWLSNLARGTKEVEVRAAAKGSICVVTLHAKDLTNQPVSTVLGEIPFN